MKYAVLLRGINVGGKNKVAMDDLRDLVAQLGYGAVETYINSGNLFFESQEDYQQIHDKLTQLFAQHYPFINSFSLFSEKENENGTGQSTSLVGTRTSPKGCSFLHGKGR